MNNTVRNRFTQTVRNNQRNKDNRERAGMIDYKKMSLYAGLFIVSMMLWQSWQQEHVGLLAKQQTQQSEFPVTQASAENKLTNPDNAKALPTKNESNESMDESIPANSSDMNSVSNVSNVSASSSTSMNSEIDPKQLIHVKTDVLDLSISPNNGDIIQATLIQYDKNLDDKSTPLTLLNNTPDTLYQIQSGLTQRQSTGLSRENVLYSTDKQQYALDNNQTLNVTLKGKTSTGIDVTKTFHFTRGEYNISVDYQLKNRGTDNWVGSIFNQLVRKEPVSEKNGMFGISPYQGASYSEPKEKLYHKLSFAEMSKSQLNKTIESGWVAMQQHYFLSALIPQAGTQQQFYSYAADNKTYTIGMASQQMDLKPRADAQYKTQIYVGPEIMEKLKAIAPGLDLTIDFGMLWFISEGIFWTMDRIEDVVGNWGWSIIFVTILIKLVFFSLSTKKYQSMARMRELQPKLQALKDQYGEDKQQLGRATMELYKQEKVNPMGGCLPVLVQIPFFFALYWVLFESVELRHAPFILWIKDLSAPDPFYILALLLGASMFWQQKLNPPPQDPMQAKVLMFMPVMMTVLFATFPSGLVLYWVVNNLVDIANQYYVYDHPGFKKA